MSKKIELTQEQTLECLRLYNEKLMGSPSISECMGIHKTIIVRTLKENGVVMGPSGRRNIGGKEVAQKKYESKPEIKIKRSDFYKEWRQGKKTELKIYTQQWNKDNKDHVNKYKRDYERKRRAEDPKYRLGVRTRTAVWQLLKERNINKTNKTFNLLGYSIEELMTHLEVLFTTGMTWDNYGEWHVDHKIPMNSFQFDSTDDIGFKECWKLSNLQPLWGPENLSKGTKLL
jgi:hypothetical protein